MTGFSRSTVVALAALALLAAHDARASNAPVENLGLYREALADVERGQWTRALARVRAADDALAGKLVRWLEFRRPGTSGRFEEITRFLEENPEWPEPDQLRRQAEELIPEATSLSRLDDFFAQAPPATTTGRLRYAQAKRRAGDQDGATLLIREAWVEGAFRSIEERRFLKSYRTLLRREDHVARLDRLLWEGESTAARHMFPLVDAGHKAVAEARLALRAMSGAADRLIGRVPESLRDDPGLVYERIRWRRIKDLEDGAIALIEAAPAFAEASAGKPSGASAKEGEAWWNERAVLARRALAKGQAGIAYRIARDHGQSEPMLYAEGEWLAGWIALRFLNDGESALKHFRAMAEGVSTPVSTARAQFWIGRAAVLLARPEEARQAFEQAARFVSTFYGQVAGAELGVDGLAAELRDPLPDALETAAFEERELVRAARVLGALGRRELVESLLFRLQELAQGPWEQALTARLALDLDRPDLAVRLAKRTRFGDGLPPALGFPVPPLAEGRGLEHALVLAIARQESAFDPEAVSGSGARGLMQIMPATAKQVAKQSGLAYSKRKLTADPDYNVRLGRSYVRRLIESYRGSYVLALAAYNAGPGNVRRWLKEYGDPRDGSVDALDWIELVPFAETRNYVQRVLEGLQVYRAQLDGSSAGRSIAVDLALGGHQPQDANACASTEADSEAC
ncbi:MAG: lytic transglycosylase domain-containing protein [Alphaproteobacteria bacterium]